MKKSFLLLPILMAFFSVGAHADDSTVSGSSGASSYDARADLNHDGKVDAREMEMKERIMKKRHHQGQNGAQGNGQNYGSSSEASGDSNGGNSPMMDRTGNPPGPMGGPGAGPRYDNDNNPPGPAGGPGTNWENPPGPAGGPGASPSRRKKV